MRIMPFMKRKKGLQFAGTGFDEGGGTTDYDDLSNKPQVGGVTLTGNKTLGDLGAQSVLTFDNTPTAGSSNPVTSGGVASDLAELNSKLPVVVRGEGAMSYVSSTGYHTLEIDISDIVDAGRTISSVCAFSSLVSHPLALYSIDYTNKTVAIQTVKTTSQSDVISCIYYIQYQ